MRVVRRRMRQPQAWVFKFTSAFEAGFKQACVRTASNLFYAVRYRHLLQTPLGASRHVRLDPRWDSQSPRIC